MDKTLPQISYDLWSPDILGRLIKDGHVNLSFGIAFEQEWHNQVVKSVKEVTTPKIWNAEPNFLGLTIENSFYKILARILQEYWDFQKGVGNFKIVPVPLEEGEYEVFYYLLSCIATSGLLGSKEAAKALLLSSEISRGFEKRYHRDNVEGLFLQF